MINELINDINNTSVKFNTASNSVSELITSISNKTPSAIAIVYDGKESILAANRLIKPICC
jgi:hypothetical protein